MSKSIVISFDRKFRETPDPNISYETNSIITKVTLPSGTLNLGQVVVSQGIRKAAIIGFDDPKEMLDFVRVVWFDTGEKEWCTPEEIS